MMHVGTHEHGELVDDISLNPKSNQPKYASSILFETTGLRIKLHQTNLSLSLVV